MVRQESPSRMSKMQLGVFFLVGDDRLIHILTVGVGLACDERSHTCGREGEIICVQKDF